MSDIEPGPEEKAVANEAVISLEKALGRLTPRTAAAEKIFAKKDEALYWDAASPPVAKNIVKGYLAMFESLASRKGIDEGEKRAFIRILNDFKPFNKHYYQKLEFENDLRKLTDINCEIPKEQGRILEISRKYVDRLIVMSFFKMAHGTLDITEKKIRKEVVLVEDLFKKVGSEKLKV